MHAVVWKVGLWLTETEVSYPATVEIASPSMIVLYTDNQEGWTHGDRENGIPRNWLAFPQAIPLNVPASSWTDGPASTMDNKAAEMQA